MFWFLLFFVGFLCLLHLLLNYNERARLIRKLPGPEDSFILGNGPAVMLSSVEVMKLARKLAQENSGIYRLWMYPVAAVSIYNPEDIETIVSSMKYNEKSQVYRFLKPWLGDGLLLSKGQKWQQRRKILTPTFHFNILKQFCEVISENTQRFVENLKEVSGRPIDVVPVISEFTLNSICETAMGTNLTEYDKTAASAYKEAIHNLGYIFYQRFIKVYYFFDFIFNLSSLSKKQDGYLKTVHSFTKKVIDERSAYIEKHGIKIPDENDDDDTYVYKSKKKTAMLDVLISARKEGHISDTGVQEEVDTFMFEGHDTTAGGLTYCFMLLANHKEAQDKILEELKEILGDDKRPITMEDLPKMKYLERCIKESLRLFPPVHFISRSLNETVTLSNYKIPAGTFCHIQIYDLHRRADLFKNPTSFDPDRFLPENSVGRHPYAYIPFSAGPRNCIGQKFAMMEMKIAVAEVLREFELQPVTRPSDIRMIADAVFRNDGPVEVTFVKRQ
ncbi:cytochrome P450 4C1-like [Helicoverpa zea]|nr:cytochrome P450 4C1-like [Helicoverpa zea]